MSTAIMPVVILSDMFDVTTMDVCEKMFDHVESNVNVLKEPQFFMACKNNLLRMCNGNLFIILFNMLLKIQKYHLKKKLIFCGSTCINYSLKEQF